MAYLRGYNNDVFFSYAHGSAAGPSLNMRPLQKWVLTFYDHLIYLIGDYLQNEDYNAKIAGWIDKSISRAMPLDQSLQQEVEGSALFVCVMSYHYLHSDYCTNEILTFKNSYADEGDNKERIFVVNICETTRESWPISVRLANGSSVPGYDFYENTEMGQKYINPFGYPGEPHFGDAVYKTELRKLAHDIASKIMVLKRSEAEGPPPPPPVKQKKIFLGLAHDTLADLNAQVRTRLESSGCTVLPDQPDDIVDQTSLDAALESLSECDSAMLLVNEYCERWPKGEPAGFVSYQIEAFRAAKKPFKAWVTPQASILARRDAHRAYLATLLENGDTSFADVEEFCRSVTRVRDPVEPQRAVVLSNRVSDQSLYMEFQEAIRSAIAGTGRIVHEAKNLRTQDLATEMGISDTLAIVCFDEKYNWARSLMKELRKLSRSGSCRRRQLLVKGPIASMPLNFDAKVLDFDASMLGFDPIEGADLDMPALQTKIAQEISTLHA